MFSTELQQQLERLQPECAGQLKRINQLAVEVADKKLLDLCSGFLETMFDNRSWQPPRALTEREKAFVNFTEQFALSVSSVDDQLVAELLKFADADEVYNFTNALYVTDMTLRLQRVMGRLL